MSGLVLQEQETVGIQQRGGPAVPGASGKACCKGKTWHLPHLPHLWKGGLRVCPCRDSSPE